MIITPKMIINFFSLSNTFCVQGDATLLHTKHIFFINSILNSS